MIKGTAIVRYDTNSDEWVLQFPDNVIESVGWAWGDTLEWTENSDGSFTITKKSV